MNFLKLLTVFLAMSMLTGIKCNKSAGKAASHEGAHAENARSPAHADQWSRINANDSAIRAQLTSLCSKSEWLDSLANAARADRFQPRRVQVQSAPRQHRLWIENPNQSAGDSTIQITSEPMEIQ